MERPNFDRWHPNADENKNACECADRGNFAEACAWLEDARRGLEYPELADDHAAAVAYVEHKAAEAGVPEAAAVHANLAGARRRRGD